MLVPNTPEWKCRERLGIWYSLHTAHNLQHRCKLEEIEQLLFVSPHSCSLLHDFEHHRCAGLVIQCLKRDLSTSDAGVAQVRETDSIAVLEQLS